MGLSISNIGIVLLCRNMFCIVDSEDLPKVGKWKWFPQKKSSTFRCIRFDGKTSLRMHRVIMGAKKGQIVDHINRDGLDNRKSNLRFVTAKQSSANRGFMNGKIGKGVYEIKNKNLSKPFRATIKFWDHENKKLKSVSLGYFGTKEEAMNAYDKEHVNINGKYATTNKELLNEFDRN
jgi:hypothetical protein